MREVKQWLLAVMAKLMPTQNSRGSDAVHLGNVTGGVRIFHTHVHNHFTTVARPKRSRQVGPTTAAHKEVLSLMAPLPDPVRIKVLNFMRREFDTAMVIDLQANELVRLRAYVVKVRESIEGSR